MDAAGASVRRLADGAKIPLWFGPDTVLVCDPSTRRRVLSEVSRFSERRIFVDEVPHDDQGLGKLSRRIKAAFDEP